MNAVAKFRRSSSSGIVVVVMARRCRYHSIVVSQRRHPVMSPWSLLPDIITLRCSCCPASSLSSYHHCHYPTITWSCIIILVHYPFFFSPLSFSHPPSSLSPSLSLSLSLFLSLSLSSNLANDIFLT